jgi:hypothetical protein
MATDMATMEELFEAANIPWVELTPEQEFGAFASQQFRPGPSRPRSAFWEMQEPLLQQYYLEQPLMTSPGQEYGSFSDYMGNVGAPGYAAPGAWSLGERARGAAAMAGLTPGQFFQYVDPQADYAGPAITEGVEARIGALTPAQQLMYRQTYGTGEQAAANQLALAELLARQRTGGGMYGGQYGRAITSAMGELSGQVMSRNPEANFLDWYLQRTPSKKFPGPLAGPGGLTQQ